jgi:hypothetical protein
MDGNPGKVYNRNMEVKMKTLRYVSVLLFTVLMSVAAYAQTQDLGQGVFFNKEGAIVLAADASLAISKIKSPYIMFMMFMGTNGNARITVSRNDVVMVYKGQEYKMPSLKEFRKAYQETNKDMDLYSRLGKESLIASQIRFLTFELSQGDFFPNTGMNPQTSTDEGEFFANQGFRTKFYFKNPGFQKGDEIILKVKDKKDPELSGSVAVILK